MGRRKKLINNTTIPQYQIEAIARCISSDILAFYDSEEVQREFAKWQARQLTKVSAKAKYQKGYSAKKQGVICNGNTLPFSLFFRFSSRIYYTRFRK